MLDAKMKLKEVFKSNSMKIMVSPSVTNDGDLTRTKDNNCYIWTLDASPTLKNVLEQGCEFRAGVYSKNKYIKLTDEAMKIFESNCLTVGPGSMTPTQTIRFYCDGDNTRIVATGWGNASVLFWEGRRSDLFRYLRDLQGGENEV